MWVALRALDVLKTERISDGSGLSHRRVSGGNATVCRFQHTVLLSTRWRFKEWLVGCLRLLRY